MPSTGPTAFSEIQIAAYYLWQRRGCPFGSPDIDWLQAEQQLQRTPTGAHVDVTLVEAARAIGALLGSAARLLQPDKQRE